MSIRQRRRALPFGRYRNSGHQVSRWVSMQAGQGKELPNLIRVLERLRQTKPADRGGHLLGWPSRVCVNRYQRKASMPSTKRPTPLQAIRDCCLGCVGGSPDDVRECSATPCSDGKVCPLWEHRSGRKRKKFKTRPMKSIRQHCLWCMGGSYLLVRECTSGPESEHPCPVWDYRLGKV